MFVKQKIMNMEIVLDGNTYVECQFTNCALIFCASLPFITKNCSFIDCQFQLIGAAAATIQFLKDLHVEEDSRPLVEAIIESITRTIN